MERNTFNLIDLTYNLPDAALLQDQSDYRCLVWEPGYLCIVLGRGNRLRQSIHLEKAIKDDIPVIQRPSGGEAVVLSPGMLVISILKRGDPFKTPLSYFETYNGKIIQALRSLGVRSLETAGSSDICIRGKKILGASIYRNKDRLLYHAVLNRTAPAADMERYLKHPPREPDYRKGRKHRNFVTSLEREGYRFTADEIRRVILNSF